jgi:hypothetical protein
MMAHKSRIAILRAAAFLADVGMVTRSVRSISHAPAVLSQSLIGLRAAMSLALPAS